MLLKSHPWCAGPPQQMEQIALCLHGDSMPVNQENNILYITNGKRVHESPSWQFLNE